MKTTGYGTMDSFTRSEVVGGFRAGAVGILVSLIVFGLAYIMYVRPHTDGMIKNFGKVKNQNKVVLKSP